MNFVLKQETLKWNKEQYAAFLLLLIPLVGGYFAFPRTYLSNINVLVGFCLLFYTLHFQGEKRVNYRNLAMMILCGSISFIYGVRMFYFLTIGFYMLFLLELVKGRLNVLITFLMLFMSPVFQQVSVTFGFPIRLKLSQWAGEILSAGGWNIKVEGNMMFLNGADFAVDEACMGLNMLAMSMLMGVFMISHEYKIHNKTVSLFQLSYFFLAVFLMNLLANLMRIMILVVFEILPQNPLHEGVGILCLLGYVMFPMWFFCRWLVRRWGKEKVFVQTKMTMTSSWILPMTVVALLLTGIGIHIAQLRGNTDIAHANVQVKDFKETRMEGGITKLQNKDLLLYVKPIPEFFTAEHTPLICWKGSGYAFASIKKVKIGKQEIYTGLLTKSGAKLYTAWWFDNGKVRTIEQTEWRLRMVKGEKRFCLVNLTASREDILLKGLSALLQKNMFN